MSKKAIAHLSHDPKFAQIIEATSLRKRPKPDGDVYAALIRTVIFQQLSGKAAATIHGRFLELFEQNYASPRQLLALEDQTLREAGVSRQKSGYLKNIAKYWIDEQLEEVAWEKLDDDELLARLTPIKGVGVWSVQMLLMFTLKRPDVFPLGDLGVRNAIIKKYRLRSTGAKLDKRLLEIASHWKPYRTLASLYLWSWLDSQ